mmetsp:Transcript_20469/g.57673  ORF Transcript_20469/g.57673 Transcript_20469/m.57673 type:complete len:222 (-) Transcript_20469:1573-2238(-)
MKTTATARTMRPTHHVSQSSRKTGARRRDRMLMSLIRMFRAGPDVSLKGSPTVSPTTQALWVSDFFPPKTFSFSIYFLELSQAPPALAIMTASTKPEAMAPTSMPPRQVAPTRSPTTMGAKMATAPGRIISFTEALVQRATHFWLSHTTPSRPSSSPSISRNWRCTSTMMDPAAFLTESMVRAPKRKGSMAPSRHPLSTSGSVRSKVSTSSVPRSIPTSRA